MNDLEQRKAAKAFAANWQGKGYEKGESQSFWLQLLGEVLGVEHPTQFIKFEWQVMLDHTSFIDAVIDTLSFIEFCAIFTLFSLPKNFLLIERFSSQLKKCTTIKPTD